MAQAQAPVSRQAPNVTPAGIGIPDMREEIEKRAKELAAKMVSEIEVWEIIAPVGDPEHEVWEHLDTSTGRIVRKYSASIANLEGTFNIYVPEHIDAKGGKVKDQVIPMFAGVARTADKGAAQWAAANFGYKIRKVEPDKLAG